MKKALLYLIMVLVFGNCIFNAKNYNKIIIDKDIQKEVESEIIDTFHEYGSECDLNYMNTLYLERYSNDLLQNDNIENDKYRPFCSYWREKGDTVIIYGFFKSNGRYGFEINIIDKTPKVYLSICNHMIRQFSYTKEGNLEYCVKVPTKTSKVTLSNMPDKKHPNIIFGLVEFESKNFFEPKYENDKEVPNQRDCLRSKMKIYFKTNKCDSLQTR